jgi:diaminopimelate decarboxylase
MFGAWPIVRAYNSPARMLNFVDGTLHIGKVSASDIANRYGTPVYIYDADVIRRQIERVTRASGRSTP